MFGKEVQCSFINVCSWEIVSCGWWITALTGSPRQDIGLYRAHGCPFSLYMAEKEQAYFLEQFYSFSGGFLRKLWIHLMSFACIIQRRRTG